MMMMSSLPARAVRHAARVYVMVGLAAFTGACASGPDSPTAPSALTATGTPADSAAKTAPAAPDYSGVWTQTPVVHSVRADGTVLDAWVVVQVKQSGTSLSGEARRFISLWNADGSAAFIGLDQGSPGKVSGTASATGVTLTVKDMLETKISFTLSMRASNDLATLSTATANTLGIQALTR